MVCSLMEWVFSHSCFPPAELNNSWKYNPHDLKIFQTPNILSAIWKLFAFRATFDLIISYFVNNYLLKPFCWNNVLPTYQIESFVRELLLKSIVKKKWLLTFRIFRCQPFLGLQQQTSKMTEISLIFRILKVRNFRKNFPRPP